MMVYVTLISGPASLRRWTRHSLQLPDRTQQQGGTLHARLQGRDSKCNAGTLFFLTMKLNRRAIIARAGEKLLSLMVQKALKKKHQTSVKFSDSAIHHYKHDTRFAFYF